MIKKDHKPILSDNCMVIRYSYITGNAGEVRVNGCLASCALFDSVNAECLRFNSNNKQLVGNLSGCCA